MVSIRKWLVRLYPADKLRKTRPELYKWAYDVDGWRLLWRIDPEKTSESEGGWMKTETFEEKWETSVPVRSSQSNRPIAKEEVLTKISEHGIGRSIRGLTVACEEIPANRGGFGRCIWKSIA